MADAPEYVVVSKPAGVPAAPTIDNLLESAPACAAAALGLPAPLLVTHRLDQCTEGLLVLGKTRAFVRAFNELVRRSGGSGGKCSSSGGSPEASAAEQLADAAGSNDSGSASGTSSPLRKFYRAVTAAPPPLGLLRHHLSIQQRHEGLPQFSVAHEAPVPGSLLSELRVLEVAPVRRGADAVMCAACGGRRMGAGGLPGAQQPGPALSRGGRHSDS